MKEPSRHLEDMAPTGQRQGFRERGCGWWWQPLPQAQSWKALPARLKALDLAELPKGCKWWSAAISLVPEKALWLQSENRLEREQEGGRVHRSCFAEVRGRDAGGYS